MLLPRMRRYRASPGQEANQDAQAILGIQSHQQEDLLLTRNLNLTGLPVFYLLSLTNRST